MEKPKLKEFLEAWNKSSKDIKLGIDLVTAKTLFDYDDMVDEFYSIKSVKYNNNYYIFNIGTGKNYFYCFAFPVNVGERIKYNHSNTDYYVGRICKNGDTPFIKGITLQEITLSW